MGDLVDLTLDGLQAPPEAGRPTLRAAALDASETTFTVDDATLVSVTDMIEFGSELMFVTAKSDDLSTATLTVNRGADRSVATTHGVNDVGVLNPGWYRHRIAKQIKQAFTYLEGQGVPLVITSDSMTADVDPMDSTVMQIEMPAETRQVYYVKLGLNELFNWVYVDDLPTDTYATGRAIRMPQSLGITDETFSVTYRIPYRWSDDPPDEDSTIQMIEGTTDVPVSYAVWKLVSGREVSRNQIDRSEEWQNVQGASTGASLIRVKQGEFFAALDAARRVDPPPRRRLKPRRPMFSGTTGVF
jgi:hypothetical protein